MSYIQSFKQRFPDKVTPEMTVTYHPSDRKVTKFTLENAHYSKLGMSGIMFYSSENRARKIKSYVTKAGLQIKRVVSMVGPPKRNDVIYLISNSPMKKEVLAKFDENEREAYFKAVDHVFKAGTAYNCFKLISQEFYTEKPKEFCKSMTALNFDAAVVHEKNETKYILFNPKIINIIHR